MVILLLMPYVLVGGDVAVAAIAACIRVSVRDVALLVVQHGNIIATRRLAQALNSHRAIREDTRRVIVAALMGSIHFLLLQAYLVEVDDSCVVPDLIANFVKQSATPSTDLMVLVTYHLTVATVMERVVFHELLPGIACFEVALIIVDDLLRCGILTVLALVPICGRANTSIESYIVATREQSGRLRADLCTVRCTASFHRA
mgnify:CR=1 FL=1